MSSLGRGRSAAPAVLSSSKNKKKVKSTNVTRAKTAKSKYNENPDMEQFRKFIYRLKQGATPTFTSMEKFKYDLNKVNDIRKEKGLEPLKQDEVRGQAKIKYAMRVENIDDVLKSVVPNVHVFTRPESKRQVNLINIDENSVITLETYIECISHNIAMKSQSTYKRNLKNLLKALGWKNDDEDIVQYLNKDFKHIQDTINDLRQIGKKNAGELYAKGSKQIIYKSVASGLSNNSCPPFEKQMGPAAKKFWLQESSLINAEMKVTRREDAFEDEEENEDKVPVKTNRSKIDWETYKTIIQEYIESKKRGESIPIVKKQPAELFPYKPFENKVFVEVYTTLGGIPRPATFLNLHVVKTKEETTDYNKNYYVTNAKQKTLISNKHKTGRDQNKKGDAIEVELKNNFKSLAKDLDELVKQKIEQMKDPKIKEDKRRKVSEDIVLFSATPNAASSSFSVMFGVTNTQLRKAYTTWVYKQPREEAENLIRNEAYIQGHSIDTALSLYASKPRNKK
jgi:hypothetical protein